MTTPPTNGFALGHPKMGGRKKGTPNKRTQAQTEIFAEQETPLEFFQRVMVGEAFILANGQSYQPTWEDQKWAAVNAAPYVHAKLAAMQVTTTEEGTHEDWLRKMAAKPRSCE